MEYTVSIPELVKRPIIRDDQAHEYLNKMTDEEIRLFEIEVDEILDEEGVPKIFPDRNAAFVAKCIDRSIIYTLLAHPDKVKEKEETKRLLTDFGSGMWKDVDIETIKDKIEELNERGKDRRLIGELGHPSDIERVGGLFEVQISRASHRIDNIVLEDNKIYGDVYFLKNKRGEDAQLLIDSGKYKFGMRAAGVYLKNGEIAVHQIFSWDIIPE